jgi:hypothetical protein
MDKYKYQIIYGALIKDCKNIIESYKECPENSYYKNANYIMNELLENLNNKEDDFYSKKRYTN